MNTDGKPWWQRATITEFESQIVGLRIDELRQLSETISGTVALMQSQLEARGRTNIGWWKKARSAMGFVVQKRHLIQAELKSRRRVEERIRAQKTSKTADKELRRAEEADNRLVRKHALSRIREQAESGEWEAAIISLVDFLSPDAPHKKDARRETLGLSDPDPGHEKGPT